jgi:2-keto-4-pentenoate hydratase
LDDAYAVQRELRVLDLSDGARLVGHKIGATSEAIRRMFGVDHPDFGYLTDRMTLPDGARVPYAGLIAPLVEGEIAFRLGTPLSGRTVTAEDVLAATSEVVPVLEVLDSRIADWAINLVDTVADNASAAVAVLGTPVNPAGVDLAREEMTLTVDGQVYTARGSAVLGHPAEAVAWLARVLSTYDESLSAGDLVLAGAWTEAVKLAPGMTAEATFSSLGTVTLTVT